MRDGQNQHEAPHSGEANAQVTSRPTGHDPQRTPRLDGTVVAVLPGDLAVIRTPAGEFVLRMAGAMPRDLQVGDLVSLQLIHDGAAASVSIHALTRATDTAAAVTPSRRRDFEPRHAMFGTFDTGEAIRPPPRSLRDAEIGATSFRQRRLASAQIARCVNALRVSAPVAAAKLLAAAPRADDAFGNALARVVKASGNGGVRSLIAPGKDAKIADANTRSALDSLDALFAPASVDMPGAGRWLVRRLPLLREDVLGTALWAMQTEPQRDLVRCVIDLGSGVFGASQIHAVAAGYRLDVKVVTELAMPEGADAEIGSAVTAVARDLGLVATLRCVVGKDDLLDFESGTRLDFSA